MNSELRKVSENLFKKLFQLHICVHFCPKRSDMIMCLFWISKLSSYPNSKKGQNNKETLIFVQDSSYTSWYFTVLLNHGNYTSKTIKNKI